MSSLVFPNVPGEVFTVSRSPVWNTGAVPAPYGMSGRTPMAVNPRYQWTISWEVLRDNSAVTASELALLVGFYNQVRGSWDTWLYQDPSYNAVTLEPFGTGDGVTTEFPIIATYRAGTGSPGIAERIQNFNGSPQIFDNGSLVSGGAYSIGPTGDITFTTAPLAGHALKWTGSFYYRCIFSDDNAEFGQMYGGLWEQKKLQFESVLLGTA